MLITNKDKIALLVAVLIGPSFIYLSKLGGSIGIAILYVLVVIPLVVIFLADQRRILVWQVCVLSAALYAAVGVPDPWFFPVSWLLGTGYSAFVPAFFYWERTRSRENHQPLWVLLGLAIVAFAGVSLFGPFVAVALCFLWLLFCTVGYWLRARPSSRPAGARAGSLTAMATILIGLAAVAVVVHARTQSIFLAAIETHHFVLARVLERRGADPNRPNAYGFTPLGAAAFDNVGNAEGTKALLAMGARVDERQTSAISASGTALDVAAIADRTEICQILIDAGADVNAKNKDGEPPLLFTLKHTGMACVPALLNHGADPKVKDDQGKTSLMFLIKWDPNDPVVQSIAQFMVAHGVDVDTADCDGKTVSDLAIEQKRAEWLPELRKLRQLQSKPRAD